MTARPGMASGERRAPKDPETKRLRALGDGGLADEYGELAARQAAIKAEAVRRKLKRAEGEAYRITLSEPSSYDRFDRKAFEAKFGNLVTKPFLTPVETDWQVRCYARKAS